MVQTTQKFELLTKKKKNEFKKKWQSVDAILEDVSVAETINAKLLISRLLSFSVPKITVFQHV